jgi:hypothetical protein
MITAEKSSAQDIKGDGNVVKESRSVSSFSKIEMDDVINVFLTQAESESVIVESDKNIIPLISTNVKDDKLYITLKSGIKIEKVTKINVYVNIRNIDEIELNGVGNLKSTNKLELGNFKISSNSVGNTNLDLSCDNLELQNNSVGNTTLTGKAENVNIISNSVGNVNASGLTAQILTIHNNSVGNAEVKADKEIYISQSGIGNITYKGNAVVRKLDKSGIGNVRKD